VCWLQLLAVTSVGTISRVNISNRKQIPISESHTGPIIAVAFASRNDRFATASLDGTLRYAFFVLHFILKLALRITMAL
jgi:WD40 repeat protein